MKALKPSILLLLLIFFLPAMALADLYQAEVEVVDQAAQSRAEGMSRAMGQVLLKVSGSARVLEDAALQAALSSASRHVQRYQYRNEAIPPEQQRLDDRGELQTSRLLLEVRFESRAIDTLLRDQGYAIWGRVRPSTLVWMAVEDGGKRTLVGADDVGLVRQILARTAAERALPLVFPMLDLEDKALVQVADVWGNFHDAIVQASERYNAQAILIGRLYPLSASQWEVRWTLLQGADEERWQWRSDDIEALVAGGIGESAEWLASRYAKFAHDSEGLLRLHVSGVDDLHAYRRVSKHLSEISGVRGLTLERLASDVLTLNLELEGGREALMRTIALGRVLELDVQDGSRDIYYRLRQ